jgi:putative ABC transport system permease protein
VTFTGPRRAAVRYELERLPGVLRAEPFRSVPARIVAGHRSRRVALLGLDPRGELRRLVTETLDLASLPPDGLLLTGKLAEILQVRPGDTVMVAVLEGRRMTRPVAVAGTFDEMLGLSAYLEIGSLERLLGEGNIATGAWLRTDPGKTAALNDRLKRLPGIAGVSNRDAALASFTATLARSIGLITSVLIGFAGSLAVAIIYNTARIAFSERAREFASLRVLGFTQGEVARMLLGEQALMVVAGLAAGLAIGYGFARVLSGLYQWELFRLPLVITGPTWLFAIGVVIAAAVASGVLVRRRLNRLDLLAALKGRE